jgi:hypothetical protein
MNGDLGRGRKDVNSKTAGPGGPAEVEPPKDVGRARLGYCLFCSAVNRTL